MALGGVITSVRSIIEYKSVVAIRWLLPVVMLFALEQLLAAYAHFDRTSL